MVCLKLSNLLHLNRNNLASLIIYEAGKSINEALADVDEAIDFCNFYAKEEARYFLNNNRIEARGVTVVIPPWNFPLAIPCGLVIASLVSGNPTILKSAEKTPLIATRFSELLYLAGVPKEIFIHLPGKGETLGKRLVENKIIATYAFTGSRKIGKMIYQVAGSRHFFNSRNQLKFPVKVIAEMGGKNTIIVTKSAEFDETVDGIIYSAFAHAGQKCSACSRILVDANVKNRLIKRLVDAISDIKIGEAFKFNTFINPIISKNEKIRLTTQIKEMIKEVDQFGGVVHINRSEEDLPGFCVGPVLIEIDQLRSFNKESYSQKELFGPVLHLITFSDLDQAVKIANNIDYALTAGIYGQSQDDIDFLSDKIQAGNLYINRPITGARVAIEPFGGYKASGTGPKAGGKDYLSGFHLMGGRSLEEVNRIRKSRRSYLEYGDQEDFTLSVKNPILMAQRLSNLDLALRRILNSFEVYFEISANKKRKLSQFKKWISENAYDYLMTKKENRSIPGQDSFNDKKIFIEQTQLISSFESPSFELFIYVISAVTVGSGVTITCLNKPSFLWWKKMINNLHLSGFDKNWIDVYFPTKQYLETIIFNNDLENIMIDGDQQYIEQISEIISESLHHSIHMKRILTWIDSHNILDFEDNIEHFVHTRSYAVNTMRYGAPLKLEF